MCPFYAFSGTNFVMSVAFDIGYSVLRDDGEDPEPDKLPNCLKLEECRSEDLLTIPGVVLVLIPLQAAELQHDALLD